MSEYREIQGAAVQSLASSTGTIAGQIWYDNVNSVFKLQGVTISASWSTGGNLNSPQATGASFGTFTSTVGAGGYSPPSNIDSTEIYNGTSWSSGNQLNTARRAFRGAGEGETAGRVMGGVIGPAYTNVHEEYDGTSWTTSTVLPANRGVFSAAGTTAASLVFGGYNPATGIFGDTLEWSGSWTTGGTLNTARYHTAGFGSPTSAVMTTGQEPALSNKTEEYDGTSWTVSNIYPASLEGVAAFGTQTDGVASGGQPPYQSLAAVYDGTSWTTTTSLSSARQQMYKGGNGPTGLVAGGEGTPGYTNATEEWLGVGAPVTQTITTT
jgi:hypothetical protein